MRQKITKIKRRIHDVWAFCVQKTVQTGKKHDKVSWKIIANEEE